MAEGQKAEAFTEEEMKVLEQWQQGDFTLDRTLFPVIGHSATDDVEVDLEQAEGWVVASQTCDIVNMGQGKEYVTICPIVIATPALMDQVARGTTPSAAGLELRENDMHVIDLGRAASLHKRDLLPLTRRDGFKTDLSRSVFAEALERRFGRFAFPNELSEGPLRYIRNRAREKHGVNSDAGRVYRAIEQFRIRAAPGFHDPNAVIGFHVVVDGEKEKLVGRKAIRDELSALEKHAKFSWPEQYGKEDEFFVIQTVDEMTAREWIESYPVDLDFISNSK